MDHYDKNFLIKFLVGIDRFGNWLSGGKFQHTISARIGRYSNDNKEYLPMWELLEAIVNLAFFPVDGPNHCQQAYEKDKRDDDQDEFKKGSKPMQFLLALIVTFSCVPIGLTLWTYKKVKSLLKPKKG